MRVGGVETAGVRAHPLPGVRQGGWEEQAKVGVTEQSARQACREAESLGQGTVFREFY